MSAPWRTPTSVAMATFNALQTMVEGDRPSFQLEAAEESRALIDSWIEAMREEQR